jgi:asparagine synthase (glutamine-hydrolysing)
MCGILGFSLHRPLHQGDILLAKKGLAAMQHRGPDGEGIWYNTEKGVLLGHRRLSILDLSEDSSQPMVRKDLVITYNGEIYNFTELKSQLKSSGYVFSTTGDTEVLLAAFRHWGAGTFDKLDGMYAFCIFDGERLHLATDPFGEKPLYTHSNDDGFYFASEVAPLVTMLGIEREVDEADIERFLGLGFLPEPRTGYKGLEKTGPATYATYDGRKFRKTQYWLPYATADGQTADRELSKTDIDAIHHALITSVKRRLVSDVPIGVFLSSGVDSALVAAIVRKELSQDLEAYTVKFDGGEVADESAGAAAIADYLGMRHVILSGNGEGIPLSSDTTFDLLGELNDNVTVLASYLMSREARKHITVAITGTGGDEIFFGYNKYAAWHAGERLFSLPGVLRKCGATFVNHLLPNRSKTNRISRYLKAGKDHAYLCVKNTEAFDYLVNLKHLTSGISSEMRKYGDSGLSGGRMFDVCQTLPNSYILNMERGAMRASIEVRTPFLNRDLFAAVQKFSAGAYLKHGRKWVAREILSRYMPRHLFELPKRGFIQPRGEFLSSLADNQRIKRLLLQHNILNKECFASNAGGWIDLKLRLALLADFIAGKSQQRLTVVDESGVAIGK